jgi:uncharacterized protein
MTFFSFILVAMVVYRLFRLIWKDNKPAQKRPQPSQGESVVEEMRQDPICGTYVASSLAVTATHKGATVYFCSNACRDKFSKNNKTD